MSLIEMDRRVLEYLLECGGRAPSMAIPAKLFRGEIPEGYPDMVELGLITKIDEDIEITDIGRTAVVEAQRQQARRGQ